MLERISDGQTLNKAKMLKSAVSLQTYHTLYGLGVGPGDPDLITVKALKILQAAPVVAFPAGINGKPGVAERIIAPWLSAEQKQLPLVFPYVLNEHELATAWETAAETVMPYLKTGHVAFACEGDASFYGTFTYLAQFVQRLHPEVRVSAIAGISSPMAAAAAAHIPLTCQSDKLAILPALYSFETDTKPNAGSISAPQQTPQQTPQQLPQQPLQQLPQQPKTNELEAALKWADVIVLMKVGSVYPQVWKILQRHQLLERSIVIENATRAEERVIANLQDHPKLQLPYFSLLIVQRTKRTVT